MKYEHLMSPLSIKGMTLRNRVMMTPMGTNLANPDDPWARILAGARPANPQKELDPLEGSAKLDTP